MRKLDDYLQEGVTCLKQAEECIRAQNRDAAIPHIERGGQIFEHLLGAMPHNPFVLYSMGLVFMQSGRFGIAIPFLERATQCAPEYHEPLHNLAVCLRRQGHVEAARQVYEKCIQLDPSNAETYANLSGAYINTGEPEKAVEYAEKALAIDPKLSNAIHHKGMGLLELGDFEQGFRFYEGRFGIQEWHARPYGCPLWRGERVETLIIHGEQGLGDEVLFLGWYEEASRRSGRIVIEATPRLVPTFRRSFPKATIVSSVEEALSLGIKFDAYCPMGSLPIACGVATRESFGYLVPDPARVKHYRSELEKLGPGPYVGLSWKGGTLGTHIYLRNGPPEWWQSFVPYATCVSLQYGEEGELAKDLGIPHWQAAIDDIDELCALIAACDLVLTVNNTCVHLAGALGVKCWTLTPSQPAWRYQLKGETIPWYDSVKQFRQVGKDWKPAYQQAERELADFVRVSREAKKAA